MRWGGEDGCAYGVAYEGGDNAMRPLQVASRGGRERGRGASSVAVILGTRRGRGGERGRVVVIIGTKKTATACRRSLSSSRREMR